MRVDSFPGKTWQGAISTVNSEVDPTTRNIRVRATFPNREGTLRPGLFVNVEVNAADQHEVLVNPGHGRGLCALRGLGIRPRVRRKTNNDVPPALIAQPRFVRLGEHRGDLVAVVSGLKEGETVVSNGAFKLRKGVQVIVNNSLAPPVELDPKPTDK
jgi:membrane fusion protein (multidrug efflux system)